MDNNVTKVKRKLDLLGLTIAGAKSMDIDGNEAQELVLYNSYLIKALADSIEVTTCEGDVDQDQAMAVHSCAEMIKLLAGVNAHLTDRVK